MPALGSPEAGKENDTVRAANNGGTPVRDGKQESKKSLVTPEVWALNQCSGIAEPRDPRVDDEHLPALVNLLAKAAEKGPHPPLTALHRPSVCRVCGYQSLCYQEHRLTPLALCAAPTRAEESK